MSFRPPTILRANPVDLADVLVAEPQQPVGPVARALDDLRAAQVGKIELRLEVGVAEDVGDLGARRRELVLDLEMHGRSLADPRASARHAVFCAASKIAPIVGLWSPRVAARTQIGPVRPGQASLPHVVAAARSLGLAENLDALGMGGKAVCRP